jgi:hypothetical protein
LSSVEIIKFFSKLKLDFLKNQDTIAYQTTIALQEFLYALILGFNAESSFESVEYKGIDKRFIYIEHPTDYFHIGKFYESIFLRTFQIEQCKFNLIFKRYLKIFFNEIIFTYY